MSGRLRRGILDLLTCALLCQAKPQAPPATAPQQGPQAIKPAQPSAPPQVQPHAVKSKPIVEPKSSRAGSGKSTLQGLGACVKTSTSRLTASAERAVKALKRDAADAAEGLLLRGRALLPRNLPFLPRALQVLHRLCPYFCQ